MTKRFEDLNRLFRTQIFPDYGEEAEIVESIKKSYYKVINNIQDLIPDLPHDRKWIYYGAIGDNFLSVALFLKKYQGYKEEVIKSYEKTISNYQKAIKYRGNYGVRLTWQYSKREVHDLFFRDPNDQHVSVNHEERKIEIIKEKLEELRNS